jgi:hypothetical protein
VQHYSYSADDDDDSGGNAGFEYPELIDGHTLLTQRLILIFRVRTYAVHERRNGPVRIQRADYKKWLRDFLVFQNKYPVPTARPEQVRLFVEKLREK